MRRTLDKRALGLAALFAVASLLGYARTNEPRARFAQAVAALNDTEKTALSSAPGQTVANAIWALGSEDAVRKMLRAELDRVPAADSKARARAFVRFGIIDSNPDGQAAVFFQACVSEPSLCDRARLIAAAERETQARLVEPGRHLPLYLMSGHPAP